MQSFFSSGDDAAHRRCPGIIALILINSMLTLALKGTVFLFPFFHLSLHYSSKFSPMHKPLPTDVDSWTLQEGTTMTVLQNPLRTRITVTGQGKTFYVPPHWHAAHDENHVVIKGRLIVTQDGVRRVLGPEDGVCFTRRGVVHSLEAFPGEEVVLEETSTRLEDVRSIRLQISRSSIYRLMDRLNRRYIFSAIWERRAYNLHPSVSCKSSTTEIHTPNYPLGSDGSNGG
jgi:mannose-6-phosphate isomerase-like protein (cupin superfamily)